MYTLKIKEKFSAAHFLPGYPHECRRMHGHNFFVEAFVQGNTLDEFGILIDFKELKKIVISAISDYDHFLLNDLADFKELSPSSENISRICYSKINLLIQQKYPDCKLVSVRIWESENCYVEYCE
ncbi:MAG: 6-carboxytetrahydropterin synthase QueD [Candidatus Wallbacteria bacterium]|nr:6-carboxytetrahydropterin synthase QueD [Candidatus Wallbacteria bacterium]